MNGQIVGTQFPIAKRKNSYSVFVNTPEKNSLSSKFNNKYVHKYCKNIMSEGLSKQTVSVQGKEPECAEICICSSTSSYIIFTNYISLESPLKCGDCFGAIPLYKIPKTYDDDYYNIICWQSDYQSCDRLQMNCSVGERFGINQLSRLDSPLTKIGLKVCTSIQEVTGKKTYYYLYKGSSKSLTAELSRKCPSCNGNWYREESIHEIFDFMCEKCGLLSNIAWDIR